MHKRTILFLLSLLALASLILSACVAPSVPTQEGGAATESSAEASAPADKTLRVNVGAYPDMMDPQKSSFVVEIAHLKLLYQGLTDLDDKLETVPGAAESWQYNEDATQLVFTLRDGLIYSDGSVLNAARFAYSLMRNIDPITAGEYASITDEIAGAPEWRGCGEDAATCDEAKAAVAESIKASHADGAECTGYEDAACTTLTLTFSKPAPYFHTVSSLWVTYPAKEELITAGGEIWWQDAANHIGNGPFIYESQEPSVKSRFIPNPNYWEGVVKYAIEYSYITDSAVSFEAYKNNEFDIVGLAAEDLEVVKADADLSQQMVSYPGSCTFAVMFHQQKEPFTDPKVREAFAYALDRDAWVTDVLRGLGSPTLTWIPPGYPGYDAEEKRWGYDPEKAKQMLAESTYGSVEGLPEITATFSDTPRNRTRNEWLVAKWKEVLGVDIKLDPVEPTTYTALTKDINTAPQMFILGWCADYPDPQNWLSVYWKTGAFGERIGYTNPDLDAMLNEADVTLDATKRMELYANAQRLLTDGIPVAYMWNNLNTYMVKPWVKGIVTTPQDTSWPGSLMPLTIDIDTAAMPK